MDMQTQWYVLGSNTPQVLDKTRYSLHSEVPQSRMIKSNRLNIMSASYLQMLPNRHLRRRVISRQKLTVWDLQPAIITEYLVAAFDTAYILLLLF